MYQEFLEYGGGIAVTRDWVNETFKKQERVKEDDYLYPEKKNTSEKKRKNVSPEPEIKKKKIDEKLEKKEMKQEKIEKQVETPVDKSETQSNNSEKKLVQKKKDFFTLFNENYYICKVYNKDLLNRYLITYGGKITSKDQAKIIICDGNCCKNFEYSYTIWDKINNSL